MADLHGVLLAARRRLKGSDIEGADMDARVIVEHFAGTTRTDAIARPTLPVGAEAVALIENALSRRLAGEPVHRILGFRDFYGLRLKLSPETLEPRPDTETLVDAVLPFIRDTVRRTGTCTILDLGTGTGAIALALLNMVPEATATGVDISADALATAADNAAELGLAGRFRAVQSDWFVEISGHYDAIVSNPPYIESETISDLQREVREHDPIRALDGGYDGLDAYRVLARESASRLTDNGVVAVEIGSTQKKAVTDLFRRSGFFLGEAVCDLAGNDRALIFRPV